VAVHTPIVDLRVWRIRRTDIPGALTRVAFQRYALRHTPGLSFVKLLGTGSGRTFTPRDADPEQWAMLTVFSDENAADEFSARSPQVASWQRIAQEELSVRLTPLSSSGRWSGQDPFATGTPQRWDGPVAALTRARIKFRLTRTFWSAVPPVISDLSSHDGLVCAFGIGEAPIGLQGTFSVWRSNLELSTFAYRGAAHRAAISATAQHDWYAEELFARFAVLDVSGTLRGAPLPVAAS
jgi:hypothetical protein